MKFFSLRLDWKAGTNLALQDNLSVRIPPELSTEKTTVEIRQNVKLLLQKTKQLEFKYAAKVNINSQRKKLSISHFN